MVDETCDHCGAPAYVRVRQWIDEQPIGRELTFCAHHTAEHTPALVGRFALVEDVRYLLEDIREPEPA